MVLFHIANANLFIVSLRVECDAKMCKISKNYLHWVITLMFNVAWFVNANDKCSFVS